MDDVAVVEGREDGRWGSSAHGTKMASPAFMLSHDAVLRPLRDRPCVGGDSGDINGCFINVQQMHDVGTTCWDNGRTLYQHHTAG